jgi:hypothetical protein
MLATIFLFKTCTCLCPSLYAAVGFSVARLYRAKGQLQCPELRSGTRKMVLFLAAKPPKTTPSFLQSGAAASIAAACAAPGEKLH